MKREKESWFHNLINVTLIRFGKPLFLSVHKTSEVKGIEWKMSSCPAMFLRTIWTQEKIIWKISDQLHKKFMIWNWLFLIAFKIILKYLLWSLKGMFSNSSSTLHAFAKKPKQASKWEMNRLSSFQKQIHVISSHKLLLASRPLVFAVFYMDMCYAHIDHIE